MIELSESAWIWIITSGLVVSIVAPYVYKAIRDERRSERDRQEAGRLGFDKPKAQFPSINLGLCFGCGSCVRACPEGGVLGLINGQAHLIAGLRCIGHGKCAEACPTGAVSVGLGDLSQRDDIPVLDESLETSVPGVHIIGELGGLALIKNAISQGNRVIDRIDDHAPLLIVGAGPSGLSAALACKQRGIPFRIIDQQGAGGTILQYPRKKIVLTQPVEIPSYGMLTKSEYTKEELLEIWLDLIQRNEIEVESPVQLQQIRKGDGGLVAETNRGPIEAQRVILALGRRGTPRKLRIPGEDLPKVMYKLMDAGQYQNEDLLVVGGGDSAVEAAMALARQPHNRVKLSYRKNRFYRIKARNQVKLKKMIDQKQLEVLFESQPKHIAKDHVLIQTKQGEQQIKNDYIFIFAGGIPPFDLLHRSGIQFGGEERSPEVTKRQAS